jgi:transcriptional regulator with XRE-family HTH domain
VSGAVGEAVRRLRRERDWSAQRLADECAQLGALSLTRGTIAKIESGVRKTVTTDELVDLAKAFGVEPAVLLSDGSEQPSPSANANQRAHQGGLRSVSVRSARTIAGDLARLNQASLERPLLYDDTSSVLGSPRSGGHRESVSRR